jgi:hypothetical protein
LFALRSHKLLLNRYQLARPKRAEMARPFDHEGNKLIALVREDRDPAAE